jgi:hypothetical protein
MHVDSVLKNETGLDKSWRLPRYLRNSVVSCTVRRGNSR